MNIYLTIMIHRTVVIVVISALKGFFWVYLTKKQITNQRGISKPTIFYLPPFVFGQPQEQRNRNQECQAVRNENFDNEGISEQEWIGCKRKTLKQNIENNYSNSLLFPSHCVTRKSWHNKIKNKLRSQLLMSIQCLTRLSIRLLQTWQENKETK